MLRVHREDEVSAFPAFVLAARAAANGRDWTGGEWTPLSDASEQHAAAEAIGGASVDEVARAIATARGELAARLAECAMAAPDEAATIRALLSGASPP